MTSPESSPGNAGCECDSTAAGLEPAILEHISSLVAEAHENGEYRPVGVAMIEDAEGRFLFVQSAKNPDDWWFPQGGIEWGEDATEAVVRESQEETGIAPDELRIIGFFGVKDLDAEAGRIDKRGFTKGKRYLFFHLVYGGSGTLALQDSEVSGYSWVPKDQVPHRLATTRAEKKLMLDDINGV